jgi:hypothetical protein
VGAWACYEVTGDEDFLRWSHEVTTAALALWNVADDEQSEAISVR